MEPPVQQENNAREYDDTELTFADILRAIIRLKYSFLGLFLIAVAATAILVGFRPGIDDPVTLFIELISIKNKTYPNGSAFSPNDILSAEVLEAIKEKYHIFDYRKLRESISVDYGSPAVEGINRKYSEQLAQKNLTQADITAINNNFAQELSGINEKGLRISVEPHHLGVSEAVAKEIALEIPKQWSNFAIKKYKIFEDKFLSSVDFPQQAPKFTDATNVLIAYKMIVQMKEGIGRSLNDNRTVSLKADNGKSAADIFFDIDRFFSIYFMPIFTYYNNKDELTFANYIDEIKLRISEIDAQIAGADSVVAAIREARGHDATGSRIADGQKVPEVVQLGEGGIKNILDLAERASLSSYLRDTLEIKRLLVVERSAQQKELDRLTKHTASDRPVSEQFKDASEAMLTEIRNDYVQLLDKSRRKLENDQHSLYAPVGEPASAIFLSKSTIYQIVGVIGATVAAMVALVTFKLFRI
jgi:hypothetical protein